MKKQSNCIIVHGCADDKNDLTYNQHWMPWVKKELIARGIQTETPVMPKPSEPDYESFKRVFEKYNINEKTIFIGHSCGCAFLVRWLSEKKKKIDKLILVAPWKIPEANNQGEKLFYEYPIDETIKSRVNKITMFTANNEEPEGKESVKIFHKALGGKVIELKGRGHYIIDTMKTEEFPELIKEVIE